MEADPVAPTVEQPVAMEPAAPTTDDPPVTRPTSPDGGAHDEGDPSDEGLWSAAATSADPAGVGAGATGDAPSNVAQDLPTVAPAASTAEVRLGQAIQA